MEKSLLLFTEQLPGACSALCILGPAEIGNLATILSENFDLLVLVTTSESW